MVAKERRVFNVLGTELAALTTIFSSVPKDKDWNGNFWGQSCE